MQIASDQNIPFAVHWIQTSWYHKAEVQARARCRNSLKSIIKTLDDDDNEYDKTNEFSLPSSAIPGMNENNLSEPSQIGGSNGHFKVLKF